MSERQTDRRSNGHDRNADQGRETASNSPSHIAYQVREGKDGNAFFNRIGAAFPHKDNQGLDVQLDAMPVNGRVTLRTHQDRLDQQRDDERRPRGRDRGRGE